MNHCGAEQFAILPTSRLAPEAVIAAVDLAACSIVAQ
jgi:hypothetical protein